MKIIIALFLIYLSLDAFCSYHRGGVSEVVTSFFTTIAISGFIAVIVIFPIENL